MTLSRFPRQSLAEAVELHVSARGGDKLISTKDAVRTMRFLFPKCEHTDEELAGLINAAAVRQGCTIAFDLHENLLEAIPL